MENALLVFDVCCCNAEPTRSRSVLAWENAQPAYAEGFGVAGAHLSRRSECEGGTPNIQRRSRILNWTFSVGRWALMTKRAGRFEVEDFVKQIPEPPAGVCSRAALLAAP